ncbi:hypothetical protein [Methylomonas koyamae]|uniref:hypothetical protein n=1 Tax=Methylomonas koyamae TaxID=702114 RepID=UPI0012FE6C6B|nr:hypothetical protein [Methylomonas koyamae]
MKTTRLALATERHETASLNERIRHAERQLSSRRRQVETAAAVLIDNIHRQMTAPASLLLASATGFIVGELTESQPSPAADTAGRTNPTATKTPLMTLFNLMASVHTLYTALPLAWTINAFYRPRNDQR